MKNLSDKKQRNVNLASSVSANRINESARLIITQVESVIGENIRDIFEVRGLPEESSQDQNYRWTWYARLSVRNPCIVIVPCSKHA